MVNSARFGWMLILMYAALGAPPAETQPRRQVICLNQAAGRLLVRARCRRGEDMLSAANFATLLGAVGPTGPAGPTGATGATGAAGETDFLVYGDGSAGDLNVTTAPTLLTEVNRNFEDLSIGLTGVLMVPSGTVIRCTGSFINYGVLAVMNSGAAGNNPAPSDVEHSALPVFIPAEPSVFGARAFNGERVFDGFGAAGGGTVIGTTLFAGQILKPGRLGGGGGGAAQGQGGAGGGTVTILCDGAIENNGTIYANGMGALTGNGGGGGGIIILASRTGLTNTGEITARGGSGGSGSVSTAHGGGGGGGIVHLMAPSITNSGTVSVAGGAVGMAVAITSAARTGGGSGGACAGSGGRGGSVPFGVGVMPAPAATAGTDGHFVETNEDPTALF